MGDNLYYLFEKLLCIVIALIGLFMIIFPKKFFKPELLEKKHGILIGRMLGVIIVVGCTVALILQLQLHI